MNSMLNMALGYYTIGKANEEAMCKEFKARAEINRQEYWDACKYPRKTKKRLRKKALADYILHIQLSVPMTYTF